MSDGRGEAEGHLGAAEAAASQPLPSRKLPPLLQPESVGDVLAETREKEPGARCQPWCWALAALAPQLALGLPLRRLTATLLPGSVAGSRQ